MMRKTIITKGRQSIRDLRLDAARNGLHGSHVMTMQDAAIELAGGSNFISNAASSKYRLKKAIREVLPYVDMHDLDSMKYSPGMVSAIAKTLRRIWNDNINLKQYALESNLHAKKLKPIMDLDKKIFDHLPSGAMRPSDICRMAIENIDHSNKILGNIEIERVNAVSKCWLPLLSELTCRHDIVWRTDELGFHFDENSVDLIKYDKKSPHEKIVMAANPYHETILALRWARSLIAKGINPNDIAIACNAPSNYDKYFLALHKESELDLKFIDNINIMEVQSGQACYALAKIILNDNDADKISNDIIGRFASAAEISNIPEFIMELEQLDRSNPDDIIKFGTRIFNNGDGRPWREQASRIWKNILTSSPLHEIDMHIMEDDFNDEKHIEYNSSVIWLSTSELSTISRKYVRLIGLNSGQWPRSGGEDKIIPDRIIPVDESSINNIDRTEFQMIRNATETELVFSYARYDSRGRQMEKSPLLANLNIDSQYERYGGIPEHAYSTSDRFMARINDFKTIPQAEASLTCHNNRNSSDVTAHDGLIRADHPLIRQILKRTQSASSLRQLLRNPQGYLWNYGFGCREWKSANARLLLNPMEIGNMVHDTAEIAISSIEDMIGMNKTSHDDIIEHVENALHLMAEEWREEEDNIQPPKIIWNRTLGMVQEICISALTYSDISIDNAKYYGEVPFGLNPERKAQHLPHGWDAYKDVFIPGTDMKISGFIDRLAWNEDDRIAAVCDYKTGKIPKNTNFKHKGGTELQRSIYAFVVREILGSDIEITSSLFYPRDRKIIQMEDSVGVFRDIRLYICDARQNLLDGNAMPGIDAWDSFNPGLIALPAYAKSVYALRKNEAINEKFNDFKNIWEEE